MFRSRHLSLAAVVLVLPLFVGQAARVPAAPSVAVNSHMPMSLSSFIDGSSFIQVTKEVEPASDKLTAETLKNVKAAGDLLKSIHVTAHVYAEERLPFDKAPNIWYEAGSLQGEGFLDLGTNRQRFDFVSHYDDWSHDPRSRDQKIVQVYDGKNSRQVPAQFGYGFYSGPPRPMPVSAMELVGIYFAFPLDAGYEEGPDRHDRSYALYSRLDAADASARRVLLNDIQPAIELTFHHKITDTRITETWYLDPEHGYARIASSRDLGTSDHHHHWTHTVVFRLLLTSQGVYYPESAIQISGSDDSAGRRNFYSASTITANESQADAYFALPTPAAVPTP